MTVEKGNSERLWNKNFTIITLGTVVSMLGNAVSGFAISLLVLDYSKSTFLFALFMVVYNLPKIIMPILTGPYLDRYSRRKIVYMLDFISAGLYLLIFLLLSNGIFHYILFIVLAIIIGSIDSIYQVAYDSLYPTLIAEKNFRKAYSISSMIHPISTVTIPIAAYLYGKIGLEPLFLFNAASFLVAAVFETRIKTTESHIAGAKDLSGGIKGYSKQFREGVKYIVSEKGLLYITVYFCITFFAFSGSGTLVLPYFKSRPELGVLLYTLVMGSGIVGRLAGGFIHYRFKFPKRLKFTIALVVYIVITLIEGSYLFTPVAVMTALMFVSGILSVTSYNIRISSTQSYVLDSHRARFNGTFQMLCTFGSITGQLLAGALAEAVPVRTVIIIFSAVNLAGVLAVIVRKRAHIAPVYNLDI